MTLRKITPYLMIFPNVFIYLVFVFIPVAWVIVLSFTNYSILTPGDWVGLANYKKLLTDTIFIKSIRNTLVYWIFTIFPSMSIGLVIAVLLNTKIRAVSMFRAAIYLPGVISGVAISMMWLWLFDPIRGPINAAFDFVGLMGPNWLKDPSTALLSIIVIGIWGGLGFPMLVYLAGLQGIPEHIYEAAEIDGATGIHKFFMITLPLLRPITFFLFVTITFRSFQIFDIVYIMTKGGPVHSTTTIVNEIVMASFDRYEMGYASSMAIFLLGMTLLFTLINYKYGNRQNDMG